MLTAAQESKHWREWGKVVEANSWRMEKKRLHPEAFLSQNKSKWHAKVWAIAAHIAAQELSAITADHLRHAAVIEAIGRAKPHKDFTNAEFDRFLTTCYVLADPDNLMAVMEKTDYEAGGDPGERRRHLKFLELAPRAYLISIIEDEMSFYGSTDVERLPLDRLRALTTTMKNRKGQWNRPVVYGSALSKVEGQSLKWPETKPVRERDPENEPF